MISTLIFILAGAFMWAKMEIEIEGKDGWAAALPTWRIENHWLLDFFYGGRPLTGYHVWAFGFVFFAFHFPLFWTQMWSWRLELRIIGAYDLFWVIEDYLWFVLNPYYGWRKFNPREVWWHKRWLFKLPLDYWFLTAIGVALLAIPLR